MELVVNTICWMCGKGAATSDLRNLRPVYTCTCGRQLCLGSTDSTPTRFHRTRMHDTVTPTVDDPGLRPSSSQQPRAQLAAAH